MTTKPPRPRRKGGPPTYTPDTRARRQRGQISVRLDPELADQIRAAAASHAGGLAGWIAQAAREALGL